MFLGFGGVLCGEKRDEDFDGGFTVAMERVSFDCFFFFPSLNLGGFR